MRITYLSSGVYSSFREAATTIWRTEGILGFYSAWKPTVSRNVPFVITTFTCRDLMHKQLTMMRQRRNSFQDDMNKRSDLGTLDNLGIGIMSALVAGAITQPIDVIKTRMMTQAASKAVPYSSALDCALTVLRTEGWQKLYSGIGQRSVYMCGLWGLTFALEPMMTNYLNSRKLSF
jgi:solute carrier family 25 S-adenosylmethionine transporter 26